MEPFIDQEVNQKVKDANMVSTISVYTVSILVAHLNEI